MKSRTDGSYVCLEDCARPQCFHSPVYRANDHKAAAFDKSARGRTDALLMLYGLYIFVMGQNGKWGGSTIRSVSHSPETMITLNRA